MEITEAYIISQVFTIITYVLLAIIHNAKKTKTTKEIS